MKLSDGFTKLLPSVLIFIFYGISFTAMTLSLKKLDLSLAYTVWAGAGVGLMTLVGVRLFHEELTLTKAAAFSLILAGVALLRFSTPSS